jgi:hypothetical protein
MPTETGGETIGEQLTRLRSSLVRARETIARAENNGQANNMGGALVTEISYDHALARARELEGQIAALEARLSGSKARPGIAVTRTVFDD